VPDAQLSNQGIDRANLDACPAAPVPQFGGCHMIFAIGLQQRKRCKALDDLFTRLRPGKSLQQFLKYKSCRGNNVCAQQGVLEMPNLRFRGSGIAAQRERPDTRVNKQRHDLERSPL